MPPVTTALIVANVAIYLLQTTLPGLALPFALWPLGASAASGGQVSFHFWQLLTYGFLHGGFVHLLFNMFALYMFGGALEQVVGSRRFTAYYLASVLAAALTQLVVMALANEIYPTVGASGGVFGLLLAYGIYFPNNRVFFLLIPFPIKASRTSRISAASSVER
jgi:membrane associated rhomboid family serine protease